MLARIARTNHKNGARNPNAQFQKEVSIEAVKNSSKIADPLGIMDCSGVSDGSAAAIVVRAEDAHKYRKDPTKSRRCHSWRPAEGPLSQVYDFTTFTEVVVMARDAYALAGITNPREQVSMAEVQQARHRVADVFEGFFELEGRLPVNPDGAQIVRHPIGASGLRMMYEMWLQLRGEAGPRQINQPKIGMAHNLGGVPGRCVSFVSVVGREVG